jgi:hypothetical protein
MTGFGSLRHPRRLGILISTLCALASAAACTPEDDYSYCDDNGCYACDAYGCRKTSEPTRSEDGGTGGKQDGGGDTACKADSECGASRVCVQGVCLDACSYSSECGTAICVNDAVRAHAAPTTVRGRIPMQRQRGLRTQDRLRAVMQSLVRSRCDRGMCVAGCTNDQQCARRVNSATRPLRPACRIRDRSAPASRTRRRAAPAKHRRRILQISLSDGLGCAALTFASRVASRFCRSYASSPAMHAQADCSPLWIACRTSAASPIAVPPAIRECRPTVSPILLTYKCQLITTTAIRDAFTTKFFP